MTSQSIPKKDPDRGWGRLYIPHEHGAWALILAPWLIGGGLARFQPAAMWGLLLGACLLSYMGLAAGIDHLRRAPGRRGDRYLRWMGAYLAPALLMWLPLWAREARLLLLTPALIPSLLSELYHLRAKRERAVVNGVLSIFGFTLILPAGELARGGTLGFDPIGLAWVALFSFFLGSLLFVRANLRGRKDARLRRLCVIYHVVVLVAWGTIYPELALAFGPGLIRTAVLLVKKPRPMLVGVTEIVTTILFVLLILRSFSH